MRPLGFSLLASFVDASRLSERLFLSSLPGSLHVSLFSAVCHSLPFPSIFSLSLALSLSGFFFFCHSDSVYFKMDFLGLSVRPISSAGVCLLSRSFFFCLSPKPSIWTHLSLTSISLCPFTPSILPLFKFYFSIHRLIIPNIAHSILIKGNLLFCVLFLHSIFMIFIASSHIVVVVRGKKMGVSIFFITPSVCNQT